MKRTKRPTQQKSSKKPVKKPTPKKRKKRRVTERDVERAFDKQFGNLTAGKLRDKLREQQKEIARLGRKLRPPKGAVNRTRKRGQRARDLIRDANQKLKRKLPDLETAIALADTDDIDQRTFINLVLALGWSPQAAYTFFHSPP